MDEKSMTPTITRSPGVPTGHLGLLCGSGGRGATADLDAAVQEAAERLQGHYGRDVTIRFNSDRQSGGAWLVTHARDSISANTEIGICASLHVTARLKEMYDRYPDPDFTLSDRLRRDGIDPDHPPASYLVLNVHVRQAHLLDPQRAEHGRPDDRYLRWPVATLDEAMTFLAEQARDPGPVIP
jgi:hypothetical protein